MKTMYASLAPGPEHWSLMVEAAAAIRECSRLDLKTGERVPLCPEHFKKNIKQFLLNCMAEVPYIASWRWAIDCLKRGWCKWAPFRYFKLVLFHPRKYKLTDIKPYVIERRRNATFRWLLVTKGQAAARTWAMKNDFAYGGFTSEQRKAWRTGLKQVRKELAELPGQMAALDQRQKNPLEMFERQRAELKAMEGNRWQG